MQQAPGFEEAVVQKDILRVKQLFWRKEKTKRLQNTISYYKIQSYKNEGFTNPNIKINSDETDLFYPGCGEYHRL